MVVFTFITERTRYGRHIFAVGGNEEAARRAGIRITRIKLSVFTLASTSPRSAGSSRPRGCSPSTSSRAPATSCCSRSPAR